MILICIFDAYGVFVCLGLESQEITRFVFKRQPKVHFHGFILLPFRKIGCLDFVSSYNSKLILKNHWTLLKKYFIALSCILAKMIKCLTSNYLTLGTHAGSLLTFLESLNIFLPRCGEALRS